MTRKPLPSRRPVGSAAEAMSGPHNEPVQMTRADMVMLEAAIRNGWAVPDKQLRDQLRRVQAVLDDPRGGDRARWRARRILELARSHFDTGDQGNE